MKLESKFQSDVIRAIKQRFNGAVVLKNDANYIQGLPDLTVLYKDKWAMLECKRSEDSKRRPNQEFYVNRYNGMSFARFIFPENMEDVLNAMGEFFEA